jgi:dolichol kinase
MVLVVTSKMVDLVFGELALLDVAMAIATGLIASVVLSIAYYMAAAGMPHWKPRKLVHIIMGSVIAMTVVAYSNLSGPALAVGIFLTILMYAWAHKSELIWELLIAGSREQESRLNTFASGFMGLMSFTAVFLIFFARPEIFVAAILAVSWGDAAGEVIGRPYGGRIIKGKYRDKSFEGGIGVLVFTSLSIIVSLVVFSPDTIVFSVLPQILIIAVCTTAAEFLSIGWTDNFFIPMVTAITMWWFLFPGLIPFPI